MINDRKENDPLEKIDEGINKMRLTNYEDLDLSFLDNLTYKEKMEMDRPNGEGVTIIKRSPDLLKLPKEWKNSFQGNTK